MPPPEFSQDGAKINRDLSVATNVFCNELVCSKVWAPIESTSVICDTLTVSGISNLANVNADVIDCSSVVTNSIMTTDLSVPGLAAVGTLATSGLATLNSATVTYNLAVGGNSILNTATVTELNCNDVITTISCIANTYNNFILGSEVVQLLCNPGSTFVTLSLSGHQYVKGTIQLWLEADDVYNYEYTSHFTASKARVDGNMSIMCFGADSTSNRVVPQFQWATNSNVGIKLQVAISPPGNETHIPIRVRHMFYKNF